MGLLTDIALEIWITLVAMAPYLLFGFGIAGILSVLVSPEAVERHLGGKGFGPVIKASLFGVPLPLCSCGVIPVAASLRRHGATRGATVAFLLSTPQTGVDSILVTYSLLGPVFAIFRPIAALVTGVLGGYVSDVIDRRAPEGPDADALPGCNDECCAQGKGSNRFVRAIRYGFVTLPGDLGRALLIGLVAAGLIAALLPPDLLGRSFATGMVAMLVMVAVGIPIYVCATASVPIAAALIAKGISPGVALVFLIAGPATNAAALATVWKVLGRRSALVYLATVAVSALLSGLALDLVYRTSGLTGVVDCHAGHQSAFGTVCAFVLLAVLGFSTWYTRRRHSASAHGPGASPAPSDGTAPGGSLVLRVRGMSCAHCADAVRRALSECPGTHAVEVDLAAGLATVRGSDCRAEELAAAVRSLGYKVDDTPVEQA